MCNNCPIRSDSISGYESCPGNLSADICTSRLQNAIRSLSWDLNYLVRMTDSVRPCENASMPAIRKALDELPVQSESEKEKILHGEGTHQEGICPVCGGAYEPWSSWSTGANPLHHNWKCPNCGTSGRTVYEGEFLGHFELVDGDGNAVKTPVYSNQDIDTCPCCGERFEPDDCDYHGYWDHGSGSYGMHGCGARGRMVFSQKFKYHADLRANRRKMY